MIQQSTTPSRDDLVLELAKKDEKINQLQGRLDELNRLIFGSSRERFVPQEIANQLKLELGEVGTAAEPPEEETIEYSRKKPRKKANHKGRKPLPDHLERKEIIIEPEQDTSGMAKIGEEITEELELIPAKLFVNRYIRPKYARLGGEGVLIGRLPSRPIEKGIAGPGLLTQILIDKYADHLPLYRQLQRFKREKIDIAKSTIGDWVSKTCSLLDPLYQAHRSAVLTQSYLQADETPIKVLDKTKKGKAHRGFHWAYYAPNQKMVLFDYQPGRGRDGPKKCLENFKGYLQTDGYTVYDWFDKRDGIELLHCMAHARRYFEKALQSDPEGAKYALLEIQKLYAIERKAREDELNPENRQKLREQKAKPVWKAFKDWMVEQYTQTTPKSAMGVAIQYTLQRWDKLGKYILKGELLIDNNPIENSIRPIALGRKNYLFAGSHQGARRAAVLYSFIGTCKLKGINPFEWLRDVLVRIQEHPVNRVAELLPQNWNIE